MSNQDLPIQASDVRDEAFKKDFLPRQKATTLTLSVSYLFLLSTWANTLASGHQQMSPATLLDFFKALTTTAEGFGLSLLPSVRPALADAVGERFSLRREAVRSLPELVRRQALAMSAFDPSPLPQEFLVRCVASHPPPIKIVMPQVSAAKPQPKRQDKQPFRTRTSRRKQVPTQESSRRRHHRAAGTTPKSHKGKARQERPAK